MYDPDNAYSFLTKNEKLFERIGEEKLFKLIGDGIVVPRMCEVDDNSFGEWLFINCLVAAKPERSIMFVSKFGFHYHKEEYEMDRAYGFYTGGKIYGDSGRDITLEEVAKEADEYRTEMERNAKLYNNDEDPERKKRNDMYDLMAELGDEDGALGEMRDLGWM